jgi:5,10-methylenetetrahydromethanopterin reductase
MSEKVEFWRHILGADPHHIAAEAERYEAEGWHGAVMVDSQCLLPEVWSTLALCAARTKTLMLTTGATNPVTRHPAVTAASVVTLQMISNGRAALGIARGDSALATIGVAPLKISRFEGYLEMLQTYLRGESVPLASAGELVGDAPHDFDKVAIGTAPKGSRLTWLQPGVPKVPLEVLVTGPKAIEMAARTAEVVILAVGADLDRLRWAIDIAKTAAKAAKREIKIGLYLPVVPHPDIEVARRLASPLAATTGRFSVMNKQVVGPATAHQREILQKLAASYDVNAHGRIGAHSSVLDNEFIDMFAVVGEPSRCVDRVREIMSLGLQRFNVLNGSLLPDDEDALLSKTLLSSDVLPGLRN